MRAALFAALCVGCGAEYEVVAPVDVDPEEVTECAFEPLAERPAFQVYTCNPVFSTSDEPWARYVTDATFTHTEVLGHPFYQIWYFGLPEDGSETQVGTAVSPDGTTWTAHPSNPGFPERAQGAWDGDDLQSPRVAFDRERQTFWMLYGGISVDNFFGIGLAHSRDGVAWEVLPENPVMALSGYYDGVRLAWPVSFTAEDEEYDAWFAGSKAGDSDVLSLYRLETDDVRTWGGDVEKILGPGEEGAFDDTGFLDATVVELDGEEYLFYVGFGQWIDQPDGTRYSSESFLGLARKNSNEEWQRVGDGLVPLNLTRSGDVGAVTAQVVGSLIHLWVTDQYKDLDSAAVGYYLYDPTLDEVGR